jgi:hypothetical protein
MRGTWWKWLSAVLAIVCGLVFGWIAGAGLVQAAPLAAMNAPPAVQAAQGWVGSDQPRRALSHSSARFQPSAAAAGR